MRTNLMAKVSGVSLGIFGLFAAEEWVHFHPLYGIISTGAAFVSYHVLKRS